MTIQCCVYCVFITARTRINLHSMSDNPVQRTVNCRASPNFTQLRVCQVALCSLQWYPAIWAIRQYRSSGAYRRADCDRFRSSANPAPDLARRRGRGVTVRGDGRTRHAARAACRTDGRGGEEFPFRETDALFRHATYFSTCFCLDRAATQKRAQTQRRNKASCSRSAWPGRDGDIIHTCSRPVVEES